MADYLVPRPIRLAFHSLFTSFPSRSTIVLEEYYGSTRSLLYSDAEVYLGTKIEPDCVTLMEVCCRTTSRLLSADAIKPHYETSKQKDCSVVDTFDNFQLKWRRYSTGKKRFFEISFDKKFKDRVMNEYFPFVFAKAREIKGRQSLFSEVEELDGLSGKSLCQNKEGSDEIAKLLFSRNKIWEDIADRPCHIGVRRRGRNWGSNDLGYKVTFETKAVDTKPKEAGGIGDTDWKVKMPNLRTTIKDRNPYRFPKSDDKTLEMVQEPEKASGTGDIYWDVEMDFSDGLQARNPYGLPKSNNKKWATMMECSLGEETDEKLDSGLQLPIALPDGGEVAGAVALSSIESAKSLSEFGVRREDVVKSLENIYNPGFHTPGSLALKSLEVLETLSRQEQPRDFVNSLSERRLTLDDCVRQDKLPDLSGTLQINTVEETVTQSPRSFGGLTAELASSSHWPIDLPDGRQILQLDSLELITNAVARGARADQSYPVESRSEKKMMRKTIKRKCRTMSGISLENLQQNFDSKCEDAVKSLGVGMSTVKRVCRQRGIYRVSKVKRIHRQHGIHRWPFRQKWAAMKGSSLGEERSFENSGLCLDEKLDSWLRTIPTPQLARYSPLPIPLLDGGNIVGPIALSLREIGSRLADAAKSLGDIYDPGFQTPDSLARKSLEALETLSRQEQPSDITYSLSEGRLTLKGCARQGKLPDPLLGTLHIYAVEERVTQLPRSLGGLTPQLCPFPDLYIYLDIQGHFNIYVF